VGLLSAFKGMLGGKQKTPETTAINSNTGGLENPAGPTIPQAPIGVEATGDNGTGSDTPANPASTPTTDVPQPYTPGDNVNPTDPGPQPDGSAPSSQMGTDDSMVPSDPNSQTPATPSDNTEVVDNSYNPPAPQESRPEDTSTSTEATPGEMPIATFGTSDSTSPTSSDPSNATQQDSSVPAPPFGENSDSNAENQMSSQGENPESNSNSGNDGDVQPPPPAASDGTNSL
jgi:hypothetical protein